MNCTTYRVLMETRDDEYPKLIEQDLLEHVNHRTSCSEWTKETADELFSKLEKEFPAEFLVMEEVIKKNTSN